MRKTARCLSLEVSNRAEEGALINSQQYCRAFGGHALSTALPLGSLCKAEASRPWLSSRYTKRRTLGNVSFLLEVWRVTRSKECKSFVLSKDGSFCRKL